MKQNTLTVIKVKGNSNVFGGYCTVAWDKSNQLKADPHAFIFSLINKDNNPLKIVNKADYAILCSTLYGPIFCGDIFISNNSNENQESYSKLGTCYKHDQFPERTAEAKNYLAGSFNFQLDEIEVYQKKE